MADGVNIKMGVSGVSQFKQNIATAKNSLKTLDAQLTLNEKQFKATGDAEEYLQQKAELLKAKLEEQKAVVAQAEKALEQMNTNGVDKASKAFQDMQQQMLRAKGELLDTQTQLANVGSTSEDAGDNVSEMNAQLARIGNSIDYQNVISGLSEIGGSIGGLITKAWKLGEALVNATLGAGQWADELQTTADTWEIDTGTLQRMRKTAQIIDTDAETILEAQDKVKKNREEQGDKFMGALAYLGIDPSGKDDISLFWEAGEAIAALGKDADKVSYANAIFGKSWREMMPLFKAGRKTYEETLAKQSVLEQEDLDRLTHMDDKYQEMMNEWETSKMKMLSELAEPLSLVMETLTGLMKEFNNYLASDEGKDMMKDLRESITGLFDDLKNIKPGDVINAIKTAIEGVVSAFRWIKDNWKGIVDAIKFIAIGFAGLKLGGLALNLTSIVKSLGGLGAGKVAADATGATAALAGTGAAKGGLFAKIGGGVKAVGGALLEAAPFALADAAVIAAAITPAVMAQKRDEKRWIEEYENAKSIIAEATAAGASADDIYWLKQFNQASGPKENGKGGYKRELFGFLDMNPTEQMDYLLGEMSDIRKRGQIYSDIKTYGNDPWLQEKYGGNVAGWKPESILMRHWGTYVDPLTNRRVDAPLETQEIDELMEYMRDLQIVKLQRQMDRMDELASETAGGASATDKKGLTSQDISAFLKVPDGMLKAVQEGMASVQINIDGYSAGRVLTPQINGNMAGIIAGLVK